MAPTKMLWVSLAPHTVEGQADDDILSRQCKNFSKETASYPKMPRSPLLWNRCVGTLMVTEYRLQEQDRQPGPENLTPAIK